MTEVVVEAGVVDAAAAVVAGTLEVLLVFFIYERMREIMSDTPGGKV